MGDYRNDYRDCFVREHGVLRYDWKRIRPCFLDFLFRDCLDVVMPIIDTSTLQEGVTLPENEQIYNGLDCCITHEVLDVLRELGPSPQIYNFTRALQAPVLDMMLRGFRIDPYERQKGIHALTIEIDRLTILLNRFSDAVWGKPLKANSPKMLQEFFFGAMRIPKSGLQKRESESFPWTEKPLKNSIIIFTPDLLFQPSWLSEMR